MCPDFSGQFIYFGTIIIMQVSLISTILINKFHAPYHMIIYIW